MNLKGRSRNPLQGIKDFLGFSLFSLDFIGFSLDFSKILIWVSMFSLQECLFVTTRCLLVVCVFPNNAFVVTKATTLLSTQNAS